MLSGRRIKDSSKGVGLSRNDRAVDVDDHVALVCSYSVAKQHKQTGGERYIKKEKKKTYQVVVFV
jgi:hypothetical protein